MEVEDETVRLVKSYANNSTENKELTVLLARQSFEANVKILDSDTIVDSQIAKVKPNWSFAKENSNKYYEAVEVPLMTRGKRMIVDEETRNHFDELKGQKSFRNVCRLVVLKNLKTGYIRSFIAIFIGSYDYLKSGKNILKNSYLYREPDFDGKVLFYRLDGRMINGWKYKDGKIVGKIKPINDEVRFLIKL
ncbi:MAG: hypothetical protein K2P55_08115 [Bacteroides acidifaciens]|nr:hypothetical protein [Bacteroides acidifaciens]